MAVDFNGEELQEGDLVVYATAGRHGSSRLGVGLYLREHPSGAITVRPTVGIDGKSENRTKHLDIRSGRFVNPWEHVKKYSHYVHADTGEEIPSEKLHQWIWESHASQWGRTRKDNPDFVPEDKRKFVPMEYQDYLQEVVLPGGYARVLLSSRDVLKVRVDAAR